MAVPGSTVPVDRVATRPWVTPCQITGAAPIKGKRSEPVAFAPYPLPVMPLSLLSRDSIAAQLRTGENPRLPLLSEAGKRQADSCAALLKHGCPLPLWALA